MAGATKTREQGGDDITSLTIWDDNAGLALQEGLASLQLPSLTSKQLHQFALYAKILVEYNEKVNLTTITDPQGIAVKHFLDSLTFLGASEFPQEGAFSLIDVGTGAGFPGVPLLIVRPEIRLTLLDSLAKRLRFLEELLAALGLEAQLVHGRAEDIAHQGAFRGRYSVATARAVASLPALLEICLPFLRPSGVLIAAKGPLATAELGSANSALQILGASTVQVQEITLPLNNGDRTLLTFKQQRLVHRQYPRAPKQIKEKPL